MPWKTTSYFVRFKKKGGSSGDVVDGTTIWFQVCIKKYDSTRLIVPLNNKMEKTLLELIAKVCSMNNAL